MSKPLKLYAIEVTHTKAGEPRPERGWLTHWSGDDFERTPYPDVYFTRKKAEEELPEAARRTNCQCKVVEFAEVQE